MAVGWLVFTFSKIAQPTNVKKAAIKAMKRRLEIDNRIAVQAKLPINPSAKAPVPISVYIYALTNQLLHSRGRLLDEKPRIVTGIEQSRVDRIRVVVRGVFLQGLRDRM